MMDSKIFATHGNNEIGRKSVCMDRGRGILGTGTTSADFQIGGINPSQIDALKMAANG